MSSSAAEQLQQLILELEGDLRGVQADLKKQQKRVHKPKGSKPLNSGPPAPAALSDITKLDIRVGQILRAWKSETSDEVTCQEIDVGEDAPRVVASRFRGNYSLEELQDRRVLVLCNAKTHDIQGIPSHGILLCAERFLGNDQYLIRCVEPPSGAKIGERIFCPGLTGEPLSPEQLEKKRKNVLARVNEDLNTDENGVARWRLAHFLMTSAGPCTAREVVDALVTVHVI